MYSQTNRPRNNAQSPQYLLPQPFPTSAQVDSWDPPVTTRPRLHSAANSQPLLSGHSAYNARIAFPEPQLYRSASEHPVHPVKASSNNLSHSRSTYNLRATKLHRDPSTASVSSSASSYYHPDEDQATEKVRSQRMFLIPEFIYTLDLLQGYLRANLG